MMEFDIITIFPGIFKSYLSESLIARGVKKKLIKINIHNLRNWAFDKHKSVDDRPFGGGLGMVMKVEPIYKAVTALKSQIPWTQRGLPGGLHSKSQTNPKSKIPKTRTILFTPRGKKFNQKIAYQFSRLDQLILICGRYEGVDERVAKHIADVELSIGDYDLMGGELPAMIVMETIARLVPGVLGKPQLLKERITKEKGFIEYSQYTRPEIFSPPPSPRLRRAGKKGIKWKVPKVLLSGNHKEIEE